MKLKDHLESKYLRLTKWMPFGDALESINLSYIEIERTVRFEITSGKEKIEIEIEEDEFEEMVKDLIIFRDTLNKEI